MFRLILAKVPPLARSHVPDFGRCVFGCVGHCGFSEAKVTRPAAIGRKERALGLLIIDPLEGMIFADIGRERQRPANRRPPTTASESDIRDNPAMSRFEMPVGDGAIAVPYYNVEEGRGVLLHTEVPQELSGLGYGSRLAHGVFEALRRDGKRVIAKCPFMSSYAARHPEYGVLLDG
jgi:predicted GNAT family acetyltransferase